MENPHKIGFSKHFGMMAQDVESLPFTPCVFFGLMAIRCGCLFFECMQSNSCRACVRASVGEIFMLISKQIARQRRP